MLDRDGIALDAEQDGQYDGEHVMVHNAISYTIQEMIKLLRLRAKEYEDKKFMTVASALRQFANELDQG